MPLRGEDLLKRSSDGLEFGLVTLLQAVIEANNRRLSFIETNCAVPESDVPNEVTGFEGLSC